LVTETRPANKAEEAVRSRVHVLGAGSKTGRKPADRRILECNCKELKVSVWQMICGEFTKELFGEVDTGQQRVTDVQVSQK